MSKILAIDLGKFKSVTCLLETETNETEFWTMATDRRYLETVLNHYVPNLVVRPSNSSTRDNGQQTTEFDPRVESQQLVPLTAPSGCADNSSAGKA